LKWCKSFDTGLPQPQLVVYLDASVEDLEKRSNYGSERYEQSEFQRKVKEAFKVFQKEDNWMHFDANQSISSLAAKIEEKVLVLVQDCKPHKMKTLW